MKKVVMTSIYKALHSLILAEFDFAVMEGTMGKVRSTITVEDGKSKYTITIVKHRA
jgi:hypothetical protein